MACSTCIIIRFKFYFEGANSSEFLFNRFLLYLPEDPVNSSLYLSYFFFLSGPPVQDSMCNMVTFFNQNLRPILTQLRERHLFQNSTFWTFSPFFIQKKNSWDLCPGLNCVKMDPKIFKKKHVAHSIPDGSPRKKIKVRYVRGNIYGIFRYILFYVEVIRFGSGQPKTHICPPLFWY